VSMVAVSPMSSQSQNGPRLKQIIAVMMIAKMPDRETEGSISPDIPPRKATLKTANPKASWLPANPRL